ncbi:8650_t:CDS:1, partial [Gigaspora margarita]
ISSYKCSYERFDILKIISVIIIQLNSIIDPYFEETAPVDSNLKTVQNIV